MCNLETAKIIAITTLHYYFHISQVVSNPGALTEEFPWSVDIPREAVNRSLSKTGGGGFAGVMRFPNMSSVIKAI